MASDYPKFKTMQDYGVYNAERQLAQRSYFIVDKQGVVRFKRILKPGEALMSNEALLEEVKKISHK